MKIVAPLLVVMIISALAILEVSARGDPALWFHVFRSVGWLAIVGVLILIYEKTGTRKLAYTGIVILTVPGILFILVGLFAFFAKLYLFSVPIIIIGGLWVWFILSRYERLKEVSKNP